MEVLITYSDLQKIMSSAKDNMSRLNLPLNITQKEVEQKQVVAVCIIESVLTHLNRKNLLTSLVNFDYTDLSSAYEPDIEPLEPRKE